jgi:tRNA(His) guanylyltransferase
MIIDDVGHINNLYNTCFWALVQQGGLTETEAEREMKACLRVIPARIHAHSSLQEQARFAADKNEMLFSRFQINYNNLPAMFRRGTILIRKPARLETDRSKDQGAVQESHEDLIAPAFWQEHAWILEEPLKK